MTNLNDNTFLKIQCCLSRTLSSAETDRRILSKWMSFTKSVQYKNDKASYGLSERYYNKMSTSCPNHKKFGYKLLVLKKSKVRALFYHEGDILVHVILGPFERQ